MPRCLMLTALMLAACAGAPAPQAPRGPVAVMGTPILWAVKVPFCAATLAVAAPLAAFSEFARPSAYDVAIGHDPYRALRSDLEAGATTNCGPPYLVSP
jgi:hypothetical protein